MFHFKVTAVFMFKAAKYYTLHGLVLGHKCQESCKYKFGYVRLCLQVQCFPTMYMSHSRLFICSKLTVQFYHLRSLWTHCSLWCNGWLAVLSLVGGKDIAYVYCTDSVILAAYIIALNNISWMLTAKIQNALSLLIAFVVNSVGGISRSVCINV